MLRVSCSDRLPRKPPARAGEACSGESRVSILTGSPLSRFTVHAAAALLYTLLAACAPPPLIISADTSCERFRHISATPAQIKVFSDNWEVMESYADAVVAHNITYDEHCLKVEK
jgi:formylmethanofuran dehydrogenase subunit A